MDHSQGGGNSGGDGGANGGAGAGSGDGGANGANNNGQGANGGAGTGSQGDNSNSNGQGAGTNFDPAALTQEQINQILEKNPNIWKADRIASLRDKAGKFDKAESDRQTAENKTLEEQGKFKELSTKQAATVTELQGKIQTMTINQALTNKLAPMGVVDLEAALALADRTKIAVDDNGTITGLDEAVEALKSGKAYLFNNNGGGNNSSMGSANNPNNGNGTGGTGATFKRSQLQDPAFYKANEKAILEAYKAGKIEDDITRR